MKTRKFKELFNGDTFVVDDKLYMKFEDDKGLDLASGDGYHFNGCDKVYEVNLVFSMEGECEEKRENT